MIFISLKKITNFYYYQKLTRNISVIFEFMKAKFLVAIFLKTVLNRYFIYLTIFLQSIGNTTL